MVVCPPSKPALGFPFPDRAFWPLCPRPEVLPKPELRPRPRRFCFGLVNIIISIHWKTVLTVCRDPADGCRLNRCTRVLDARAADMVELVYKTKQAVGNARETLRAIIAVDRFPNFPIHPTPSDFELHNGEYKSVSIDDRHSDVIIT